MSTLTHTSLGTKVKDVLPGQEISGSFSITKDGLHFEVVASGDNYSFKIFDLLSTRLLHEGEVKKVLEDSF